MATRNELLSARQNLRVSILASEEWQPSYKKDKATFKELVSLESELETAVAEYLSELSERALTYVDWTRLPDEVKADAGPVLNNSDPAWKREQTLLTKSTLDLVTRLVATGAVAGEHIYGIPVGFSVLDEAILQADRKSTRLNSSHVTTSRMPSSA